MFGLGGTEIVIVLLIVLVLFGARRLPELGKGLGQGIREFRKASHQVRNDREGSLEDEASPPPENAGRGEARLTG